MPSKVEIYDANADVDGAPEDWHWRLKAANGEIVASGEGYTTKTDAMRGWADAKRSAAEADE